MGSAPFAGVELGGTKCVCTLARSNDEILDQQVIPTRTPDETLAAVEQLLSRWRDGPGIRALGIASFGPIDLDRSSPTYGAITTTPKPGWAGTDVAGRLRRKLEVPTGFDTDVNGAALAELRWGAGRGVADLAYVTVGTGVGVGIVAGGRPIHGFGHPELGHIRVARRPGDDWPGTCPFHGGCVEGLASGPAILSRLGRRDIDHVSADDPIWEDVAWPLAQLCHALVCATAPQRILIGGGVAERQPHLVARIGALLVESLAGYVDLPAETPYLRPPGLGAMAGPLGAIALAMDSLRAD